MSTTPQTLYCPVWRRLVAMIYDLLAVVALVMMVGYACQRLTGGELIHTGAHTEIPWWYQPLQGLVVAAYFVISWLRGGHTLGMRAWRIRLTRADGSRVTLGQAVLRVLAAAAPLLLLALAPWVGTQAALWSVLAGWVIWFGAGLFDARHRAVHDMAAATQIIRIL